MKKKQAGDVCSRISHLLIGALTGQTKMHVTIAVYSLLALLLLGYVSAQIYTSVLAQGIAERKDVRYARKECLSKLTSDYVALSSRERISSYCESVLGMTPAGDEQLERFAVRPGKGGLFTPVEFARKGAPTPDPFRFSLNSGNRAIQR